MPIPKLTVVIPTLNEANYLPRLLSQLQRSDLDPTIIIADAQSTDDTLAIAKQFNISTVPGGWPSVGRNAGAKIATSELILFLDADVTLGDPNLEKYIQQFINRNLDIANFKFATEGISIATPIYLFWNWLQAASIIIDTPLGGGGAIMVRTSAFNRVGGFNESLQTNEDHDLMVRMRKNGYKFGVINSYIYPSPRRYIQVGPHWVMLGYFLGTIALAIGSRKLTKLATKYYGEEKMKK